MAAPNNWPYPVAKGESWFVLKLHRNHQYFIWLEPMATRLISNRFGIAYNHIYFQQSIFSCIQNLRYFRGKLCLNIVGSNWKHHNSSIWYPWNQFHLKFITNISCFRWILQTIFLIWCMEILFIYGKNITYHQLYFESINLNK